MPLPAAVDRWANKVSCHKHAAVSLVVIGAVAWLMVYVILNHDYRRDPASPLSRLVAWTWGCVVEARTPLLQRYSQTTKAKDYNTVASPEENAEFVKKRVRRPRQEGRRPRRRARLAHAPTWSPAN